MGIHEQISVLLDKLITDGKELLQGCRKEGIRNVVRDMPKFHRWSSEILLFKLLTGTSIEPWVKQIVLHVSETSDFNIDRCLAALETIRYAMDEGLLVKYEDLIFAEAFADFHEQGQHLFTQGYFLAAGVVFRAVLEERLRHLCKRNECTPSKEKPTINDFNNALYMRKPPVYDKGVMQYVTALATVGNDAAHKKQELTREDVKRLQDGLLDFLGRFKG